MSPTSLKAATAAAICLCAGCLLCASAAPAPANSSSGAATAAPVVLVTESTEKAAIEFIHKTFYSNAEYTEAQTQDTKSRKHARTLILEEIKRIGFNFASIANRTLEDWQYIVRSLFMSYYLKQKSMSERVTNLLYDSLGIKEHDKPNISKSERAQILNRIPIEVINRVDKWNERPLKRIFEEFLFIGSPKPGSSGQTAWSFVLEKPTAQKVLAFRLGIHLSPASREKMAGMVLIVRHAPSLGGSVSRLVAAGNVTVAPLSASGLEEIQVDVTKHIMSRIHTLKEQPDGTKSQSRVELFFYVECPSCSSKLDVSYMVMDCRVKVDAGEKSLLSRETREAERLQWPFDNTTATEVFKNHPPGATFTKTQMCIIENVNRRYGQKSCCLMDFTYDMSHQGVVLAPRQLRISYCAGECHGQSQVHTPHSSLLQIVVNSQLSHETKEDINLCCVANTYRDFQVLTVGPPPADSSKSSVQLKIIKDISAESCTCA